MMRDPFLNFMGSKEFELLLRAQQKKSKKTEAAPSILSSSDSMKRWKRVSTPSQGGKISKDNKKLNRLTLRMKGEIKEEADSKVSHPIFDRELRRSKSNNDLFSEKRDSETKDL